MDARAGKRCRGCRGKVADRFGLRPWVRRRVRRHERTEVLSRLVVEDGVEDLPVEVLG